jgi:hypothetical protein
MMNNLLEVRGRKHCWYNICWIIAKSYIFNCIIVLCIIGNAIILSMDHYPISDHTSNTLEAFNLFFFAFFVVELIIKLCAQGFKFYFRDKFNWFDSLVVFMSSMDVILTYSNVNNSAGSGAISALRVFRLLRIFQLAKVWK